MPDLIMLIAVLAVAASITSWLRSKPLDVNGRMTLTTSDRLISAVAVVILLGVFVWGQIDLYGVDNPWILVTPVMITIFVFLRYKEKQKRK